CAGWRLERERRQARRVILERLIAAYRQFHLASGNYFVPRRRSTAQALRLLRPRAHFWQWRTGWQTGVRHAPSRLSVEALSALWHLPHAIDLPELALVERRLARTLLMPAHLVHHGTGAIIGHSEHAGHRLPFAFPASCLQHHMLLLGKSGEGKSTCMTHLATEAMH
ncbi:MAG: hypothetical protein J2P37_36370, partial [Ktedonobacteraceae bacterium]|nr:hypothetical protein [Ktedonobacteraceae bacterium]